MEPFAGKAKLCSPAITNGGAPMGTAWLDAFLAACSGCTIDCIAFHIYDSATNLAYFESYIKEIGTKYGKPTFMTEVCCPPPGRLVYRSADLCSLVRCIWHNPAAAAVPPADTTLP